MIDELTLQDQLESAVVCGQAGILVRSHDYDDVIGTLFRLSKEYDNWDILVWDRIRGLQGNEEQSPKKTGLEKPQPKASLAAVEALRGIALDRWNRLKAAKGEAQNVPEADSREIIMVLYNGHREIVHNMQPERDIVASIQITLSLGRAYNCHLVVLVPPGFELPEELRELFWVFDHELPNEEEREEIITDTLKRSDFEVPEAEKLKSIVKVCGGLTRQQVEGVCARSLSRFDEIRESFVWKLKAGMINKSGMLQLHRGEERFETFTKKVKGKEIVVPGLGGLEGIKKFCLQWLEETKDPDVIAQPKGVLLLGVPGTGKSAFAKALGSETKRPTLLLNVGTLMGGLVGQTEERTREMLRVVDAMAPCILFVDEIEKALGGSGGEHDGGVNARLKGTLLSWLNDHESDVFFVATANDISMLPPEMTRAERFDATFFMDLPSRHQKDVIWDIYTKVFKLDPKQARPKDTGWTGAEIKSCCKIANRFRAPLVEVAPYVIPVFKTWREKITALRHWAAERCIDAETGEVYVPKTVKKEEPEEQPMIGERSSRKVTRRTKGG